MTTITKKTKFFDDTVNNHLNLAPKIDQFIRSKREKPTEPFGKDTYFVSAGPIGRTGLKLKHAHVSQDVAVVYRVHGKNPHILELYGVYSHKELGTGNTPNVKIQKKMAKKFKDAVLEGKRKRLVRRKKRLDT